MRFDPHRRRLTDFADARDAFARFEGFQFQFIEIDDFAALAEAALHQKTSESFFGLMRRREFDVPEIAARFKNVNGVQEAFGFAVDFGDDASACGFGAVAFERTLERDFLARKKFFANLQNAAVTADEKGLRENTAHYPGGVHPGGFERNPERDAIALAKEFCARGGHEKGKCTAWMPV